MQKIYVQTELIERHAVQMDRTVQEMNHVVQRVNAVTRSMHWNVSNARQIERTLQQSIVEIQRLIDTTTSMASFLREVSDQYQKTEMDIKNLPEGWIPIQLKNGVIYIKEIPHEIPPMVGPDGILKPFPDLKPGSLLFGPDEKSNPFLASYNGSGSGNPSFWDAFLKRYGFKNVIKSFGNAGKIVGFVGNALNATSWKQWGDAISVSQTISKIAKDYKNYKKIGRAIGTQNANSYFLKKLVGLRTVGHASTAKKPMSRFYNNLHNTTSPFNLSDAFAPLTGAKGVKATAAAWAGVALTGITNSFSNIEEQKQSNGTMSTGRVVAETISETALDTVITYGASAVVGAAITAATGAVAAPVVVAVATGVGLAAINAGVEALSGKSATEWASDFVLDTAVNVGKGISNGTKAVGNWFNNLSFAW